MEAQLWGLGRGGDPLFLPGVNSGFSLSALHSGHETGELC